MNDPNEKPTVFNRKGGIWSLVGVLLVAGIVIVSVMKGRDGPPGPAPEPAIDTPKHLILISIDTLRADRLGCYGYAAGKTPAIDALATEGVLFERHYSSNPLTLPAHLTQLTGVTGLSHRVRDNLYHRLPEGLATLPEALAAQGFRTGAFVSAHTMKSGSGIERGFGTYDDAGVRDLQPGRLTISERKAADTLRLAEGWIARDATSRLFCFIHLFDPHAPYEEHKDFPEYTGSHAALYDGEVAYTDREIGRFLSRLQDLRVLEDALVVITADHGEGLGDNNELTHGYFCYDATTHVPLIIRGARGITPGTRVPGLARNYDLAPTLLELMGIQNEALARQAHGVSLVPMMREPGKDLGLTAYLESHYAWLNANWARIRGLRTADGLVLFSADETQVIGNADATLARTEVERLMNSWRPPATGAHALRESMAGTPYPGESPVPQSFEPESLNDTRQLPAPHLKADLLRRYQQAELLYDEQRFEMCAQLLRAQLNEEPDFPLALKLLAAVNQGLVQSEWRRIGESAARSLTHEAAECVKRAIRVAEDHSQIEAATSMRRNLALLAAWLADDKLATEAESDDGATRWLAHLARFRAAPQESRGALIEPARRLLDAAGLSGETLTSAQLHLQMMEDGGIPPLAPWEQP